MTASFAGVANLAAPAASDAVAVAVAASVLNALAFGGPAVTSNVFVGPRAVVVTLNRGLLLGPAQDSANDRLVGPHNQAVAITSAVYNPANASVTLTTGPALGPHLAYRPTIDGHGGGRVINVFGIALNGHARGKPGHDDSGRVQVKKVPVAKVAHARATPTPTPGAAEVRRRPEPMAIEPPVYPPGAAGRNWRPSQR